MNCSYELEISTPSRRGVSEAYITRYWYPIYIRPTNGVLGAYFEFGRIWYRVTLAFLGREALQSRNGKDTPKSVTSISREDNMASCVNVRGFRNEVL